MNQREINYVKGRMHEIAAKLRAAAAQAEALELMADFVDMDSALVINTFINDQIYDIRELVHDFGPPSE